MKRMSLRVDENTKIKRTQNDFSDNHDLWQVWPEVKSHPSITHTNNFVVLVSYQGKRNAGTRYGAIWCEGATVVK